MAFDGTTIAAVCYELNKCLLNGRINKIAQPEKDELILTIKNERSQYRLLISANASLPLIYLTDTNKPSPITAPGFCMLLRKYINNGRITKIYQPGLERIIHFEITHLNELGDECVDVLIVELMGKHSNIIFCDRDLNIIDSIKHVNVMMSSIREVLPGRKYFVPMQDEKANPLEATEDSFANLIRTSSIPVGKVLFNKYTGISPVVNESILFASEIESEKPANELSEVELLHLSHIFLNYIDDIKNGNFDPTIYSKNDIPVDYSALPLSQYSDCSAEKSQSISEILEKYYRKREIVTNIRKKSTDLRLIINNSLTKASKKYALQRKQLKDTEKRDKYKLYGELLTAYAYSCPEGVDSFTCNNYYDNDNEIKIPLNPELSAMENAKKYFEKYNKQKRTKEALDKIIFETEKEIDILESISVALEIATDENDLTAIRKELTDYGYIKKKHHEKIKGYSNKPIHIQLDENTDIYIGKNNYQNEEVSFKIATGNDWWFHTKNIPGSHVVVKTKLEELPDKVFEIAGGLAAFYSKARNQEKVEVDYTQKKNLKRVNGAAPGFVIYHTNYSLMCSPIDPKESGLIK